jgi:nucleotide-binding universal stress UspA family protein
MDPAGAIHEALHRTAGAIACMASHGRNDSAALTGSITTDVIARGHDPLVVVGRSVALDIEGEGVVACIDETAASRASLPSAARMADLLAEPLTVITVAEPVTPPLRPGAAPRRRFGPDEDADRYLDAAAASWRSTGYAVETRAVYDPTGPAAGVLDFLQNSPAALVTVASRARTGTARLRFGSVAAEIVGSVTCPVLVVPRSDAP